MSFSQRMPKSVPDKALFYYITILIDSIYSKQSAFTM